MQPLGREAGEIYAKSVPLIFSDRLATLGRSLWWVHLAILNLHKEGFHEACSIRICSGSHSHRFTARHSSEMTRRRKRRRAATSPRPSSVTTRRRKITIVPDRVRRREEEGIEKYMATAPLL